MLKLAKDSSLTDIISDDGSNPLTTQHPITGSAVEVTVFLFNDNGAKRYESVTIESTGDNADWIELAVGDGAYQRTVSIDNIDDTTGHAVKVRVTTPQLSDTQNISTIKLTVTGTEFAK